MANVKDMYVVTHPQATHHVEGLVGGWFDSDLTQLGLRHAEAIAKALSVSLKGQSVQTVSSDLRRARQTADVIISRLGGGLRLDRNLREKSYGAAEGRPQAWLRDRQVPIPEYGERLRHDEGISGAETRMDLATRAYAAMAQLEESVDDRIVVVTHGGTATLLLAAWIEMPIEAAGRVQFRFTSGGITHLHRNDRTHSHEVAQLNQIAHLAA